MKRIEKTHDLALWLNRGNSIVVGKKGVEPGLYQGSLPSEEPTPVMVAAYSGKKDGPNNYRRRVTIPYWEEPLVKLAGDFRLTIRILRSNENDIPWLVECQADNDGKKSLGDFELPYRGISSEFDSAMAAIRSAALNAILDHAQRDSALKGTLAWTCEACA
jgi:hypothetical protein